MKNTTKNKSDKQPTIQINRNRIGGKKKPDLFAKFRNTEHPLDNIVAEQKTDNILDTGTPTSTPTTFQSNLTYPVSPEKNYQKVTNSITKDAIPQRLFRTGKTKEIYDVLYGLTRGAVNPQRSVFISKPKLRLLTGVGSRVTIDTCLGYLEIVGLVKITTNHTGQHEGNEYEIFTPEEIGAKPDISTGSRVGSSTGSSRGSSPAQTLGVVPRLVTRRGSQGSEAINTGVTEEPKTSFKDLKKNDDEAYVGLIEILDEISEKATGRAEVENQKERWKELGELLRMEFEVAAARTDLVSNVPAFLTEHLRRRLLRKPASESAKENIEKMPISRSVPVGKQTVGADYETEEFIPEQLTEKGRETVLETMAGYLSRGQREFVMSLRETYTKEDWDWLEEKLAAVGENSKVDN